jgi:hypothetical protein
MEQKYDVIVAGGGTAGVVAAIQAARAGARTLLLEKTGILGGTMVTGAIPCPASFHAHGRQVIRGIGWELCCRALKELDLCPPDPLTTPWQKGGRLSLYVNPAIFAAMADEMAVEAGADILFHAMPASVTRASSEWKMVVCTKKGLQNVSAINIVDCTGDANVVELAGFKTNRNPDPQPGTLVVWLEGYDANKLDYAAIQSAFDLEAAAGRMKRSDPGWWHGRIDPLLKGYGGNCIHIPVSGAHTSDGRTKAEIEGRAAMMRLMRFFRKQPGLEGLMVKSCAAECGIRETVTIKGRKTITIEDYECGRIWEDAVCYSFYAVDVHRADRVDFREIPSGIYPTIPLCAMLPKGSKHLIVAGRCVSGDQEANSAYRVQASCMAMGQAAGAAAALAAGNDSDIEDVPIADLRELLRRHNAIVPGDFI